MQKLDIKLKEVIEILCEVIKQRRLIEFYYESARRKVKRTIRPYIIIPIKKNIELVGTPTEELNKSIETRKAGHYILTQLLTRIETKQFKILLKTFVDPGVVRDIVNK